MKEKNFYVLIPNKIVNKQYIDLEKENILNVENIHICVEPTEYHKQWYGDNLQLEVKESIYEQKKIFFQTMDAIKFDRSEAFLKKFPHPNIETDGDILI